MRTVKAGKAWSETSCEVDAWGRVVRCACANIIHWSKNETVLALSCCAATLNGVIVCVESGRMSWMLPCTVADCPALQVPSDTVEITHCHCEASLKARLALRNIFK